MQYVAVKNLERYHPGYKDRQLKWAKIWVRMVQGDHEFEMIEDEIDKWRFVTFILLELSTQKPTPINEKYLIRKGFDLKKRKIDATIKALSGFVEIRTEMDTSCNGSGIASVENRVLDKIREEEDKKKMVFPFEDLWGKYPNKDGKKDAIRHFNATVKTPKDWENINDALANYLKSERVQKGFIKNASTWFNNWSDWIPEKKLQQKIRPISELLKGGQPECKK